MESVTTSPDLKGTNNQWSLLELYLKTGRDIHTVTLTLGLGGFGRINTGKASFADVRMEEVDTIPDGVNVVTVGSIMDKPPESVNNAGQVNQLSLPYRLFNYWWLIWLSIITVIMLILAIYRDFAKKEGLYLSWKPYLLLAYVLLTFYCLYAAHPAAITTMTVQWSFIILLILTAGCALYLWKTGKWRSDTPGNYFDRFGHCVANLLFSLYRLRNPPV